MGTMAIKTMYLLSSHSPDAGDMYPWEAEGQFLFAGTNILKKKISRWGGVGKNLLLMPQNAP